MAQLKKKGFALSGSLKSDGVTFYTKKGKIIYAILLGLLTALFRFFGESAEGVSFAIIIGNICVPLIERFTIPKPFGLEKKAKEGA